MDDYAAGGRERKADRYGWFDLAIAPRTTKKRVKPLLWKVDCSFTGDSRKRRQRSRFRTHRKRSPFTPGSTGWQSLSQQPRLRESPNLRHVFREFSESRHPRTTFAVPVFSCCFYALLARVQWRGLTIMGRRERSFDFFAARTTVASRSISITPRSLPGLRPGHRHAFSAAQLTRKAEKLTGDLIPSATFSGH